MNDIDLNEIMDGRSNDYVSPLKVIEWFPLNTATPFVGTIYGNGHTINGFYMRYSLSNPGLLQMNHMSICILKCRICTLRISIMNT